MNKTFLILVFLQMLLCQLINAHNANEAFFEIRLIEDNIIVKAEFPWTLRNALYQFNPALEHAIDKAEFEATFFDYIKANLLLMDVKGNPLLLKQIKELPHSGHSHQGTYDLFYQGNTLGGIENRSQFSLYPNQINYHKVILLDKKYEFSTTMESPSFQFSKGARNNSPFPVSPLGIGIIIGLIIFLYLLKKDVNKKDESLE